jgi:heterotetrameric sarcosine oxidase gamma subunit
MLEFLSPAPSAVARSPMEREARAAGATIQSRDGWNVAVAFDGDEPERLRATVGFADRSPMGKLEVQASAADLARIRSLELGTAVREDGAWWCPYSRQRALVLCEPGATAAMRARLEQAVAGATALASVTDLTSSYGALTIAGPLAREVFARFTAADLRDKVTPVHGFRPVSVARTPGAILREGELSWLMLFGAALGSYVWTVVADAAGNLGGGPVGVDALA